MGHRKLVVSHIINDRNAVMKKEVFIKKSGLNYVINGPKTIGNGTNGQVIKAASKCG